MKVEFKLIENIPNGFKCAGCSRLKYDEEWSRAVDRESNYCELNRLRLSTDKDGISLKTPECLLQTRLYLIREGLK